MEAGAYAAVIANHWAKGGAGATDLGNATIAACEKSKSAGSPFKLVTTFEIVSTANTVTSLFTPNAIILFVQVLVSPEHIVEGQDSHHMQRNVRC